MTTGTPSSAGSPCTDSPTPTIGWSSGASAGTSASPSRRTPLGRLIRPADTSRTDLHSGGSDVTALLVRDEGRTVSLTDTGRIVDEVVLSRPRPGPAPVRRLPPRPGGEQEPGEKPYRSTPLASPRRPAQRTVRPARHRGAQRFSGVPRLERPTWRCWTSSTRSASSPAWRRDLRLGPATCSSSTTTRCCTATSGPRVTRTTRSRAAPALDHPAPRPCPPGGLHLADPGLRRDRRTWGRRPRDVVDLHRCRTAQRWPPPLRAPPPPAEGRVHDPKPPNAWRDAPAPPRRTGEEPHGERHSLLRGRWARGHAVGVDRGRRARTR